MVCVEIGQDFLAFMRFHALALDVLGGVVHNR
jgi:hypothetical protein